MTSTTTERTKELTSLQGEYLVAAELCKRGFYAQLTFGNHKKTDILVEGPKGLLAVSVKSKNGPEWFRVTGIWRPDDFLVFVDFQNGEGPEFYILGVEDWKRTVRQIKRRKLNKNPNDGCMIDANNTMHWPPSPTGKKKGWVGCSVKVSDIAMFRDCWSSLPSRLSLK